jgi:hypothetical protein
MFIRGLQFYTFFWNFNRNETENDRYWQKNNFLLFAKGLKMYNIGIKNAEFYADFQFVDASYQKCPKQKLKAINLKKMHKNENTQNSHRFLAVAFFRGICLRRHQRI